jgi:hypothetical protein
MAIGVGKHAQPYLLYSTHDLSSLVQQASPADTTPLTSPSRSTLRVNRTPRTLVDREREVIRSRMLAVEVERRLAAAERVMH